jgi:hypothetical protein
MHPRWAQNPREARITHPRDARIIPPREARVIPKSRDVH